MKIEIIMKTPDCLYYAAHALNGEDREKFFKLCEKWFLYGEVVKLEVDTEKGTCIVL